MWSRRSAMETMFYLPRVFTYSATLKKDSREGKKVWKGVSVAD